MVANRIVKQRVNKAREGLFFIYFFLGLGYRIAVELRNVKQNHL